MALPCRLLYVLADRSEEWRLKRLRMLPVLALIACPALLPEQAQPAAVPEARLFAQERDRLVDAIGN